MLFLKPGQLSPGMILARNIHYYDLSEFRMIELKQHVRLTDLVIEQLRKSSIDGAYIEEVVDNITNDNVAVPNLRAEIKEHAINGIKDVAKSFINEGVTPQEIAELNLNANSLMENFCSQKDILVNVFDLKMYDDYTYYHSLSVAVIALSIGIELGFSKEILLELTLSGLLHDIGKVAIPIEIISKPSKLTPAEFQIVKSHPQNAGNHLLKRGLISANTFKGIIGHHEKWDGSGYPNGLEHVHIPLFGRVLAVADIYDALTSNRPYRTRSEPTEAIEYIMGGAGTYFDIDVVKAFLKRIAPYPAGMAVKLSNGKTATVIENNVNQPLRPIVSLNENGEIYDLYNDFTKLNVIITGCA